jgi:diguanylate cyclase
MDYSSLTREQLITLVRELTLLKDQLLEDMNQETSLEFAWTGNLGHWYLTFETGNAVFNPLKLESLGFTAEEVGIPVHYSFFTDRIHPDDYEATMEAMRRNMGGDSPVYECEYRIAAKDGSWKWFLDRGKVTKRDESGRPLIAAGIVFDITDTKMNQQHLESVNRELQYESTVDSLTGILNRRAIMNELKHRMEEAMNRSEPLTAALFDLDNFKRINDTYGHLKGDEVLKGTAEIIQGIIRGLDSVGRYGGEEFLLIFPRTSIDKIKNVSQRILSSIRSHDFGDGVSVTISGGVSMYEAGMSVTALLEMADSRLYQAKELGRNRVVGFEESPER